MSTSTNENDYATDERLAIYLEIGWSDVLFGTARSTATLGQRAYPDPLEDVVTPCFYSKTAGLARQWADAESLTVDCYCDVGGATGRMMHEIDRQFPNTRRLVMVEPSRTFCNWAARLLSEKRSLPEIPAVGSTGRPRQVEARSRPNPLRESEHRLEIFNGTLEDFQPAERFDLATCLNVVDRHPDPAALVRELERLMNPGGLLVMSSPFDFTDESTPDRDAWIDDLNVLFDESSPWRHVGEDVIHYEYRSFNRCWVRFAAQVVAKRWHGT